MALIDAPAYDPRRDNLQRNILIGTGIVLGLAIVLGMGGFVAGHGWFFSNVPAEHRVGRFLTALEAKDYPAAYNIYTNGHPDSGYPVSRFTEDWTTKFSPAKGPVTSHHIEASNTEGKGLLGSGVIVATHLNSMSTCAFIRVDKKDGTLTWPAFHEIALDRCHNAM